MHHCAQILGLLSCLPRNAAVEDVDRSFLAREEAILMAKYHLHRAINIMKQRADSHLTDRELKWANGCF